MIKVIIADDDFNFCNILQKLLTLTKQFKVIGIAHDGKEAYQLIKTLNPNVAIIDIMLPVWDGIEVIKRIYMENINPNMIKIALSGESKPEIVKMILDYDAYYFCKPFDPDLLIDRILCFHKVHSSFVQNNYDIDKQHQEIKNRVSNILEQQSKDLKTKGYQYFLDATVIAYYNKDALSNLTKNIYKPIAEKNNTNISNIERQMRYCINSNINSSFISNLFKKNYTKNIDKKYEISHPVSVQQMLQSIVNKLKEDS